MKRLLLICLLPFQLYAQTARDDYDNAARAYEIANYTAAIAFLKAAVIKLKSTNPKIESLKALCFYAQEDYVNAKIALNKYFKMVSTAQTKSDNHKSLVIINSNLTEQLQREEKNFIQKLQKKRLANATQIENDATQILITKATHKQQAAVSRMYVIYNNSSDKQLYNDVMKKNLGKKEYEKFQYDIKTDATSKTTATAGEINVVLKKMINRKLEFHIFPDGPTASEGPFILESIEFNGRVVDYSIICKYGSSITIKERGTFQGLDLAKIENYRVSPTTSSSFQHIFTFASPVIWKSGSARYSDGKMYNADITYSKGLNSFVIEIPAEYSAEVKASFEALIKSTKDVKSIRY